MNVTALNKPVEAFLSLGGNIGDPSMAIDDALSSLSRYSQIEVLTRSPFYTTPPWGKTDQPDFINACAKIITTLSARELLQTCLDIERSMGRKRDLKWGPRVIDIDILTYGAFSVNEQDLIIPHPLIKERAFVLVPLRDIAPDFSLNDIPIDRMIEKLDQSGITRMDRK